MPQKCILISETLWKRLMEIKINKDFKSIEQVILSLLNADFSNNNDQNKHYDNEDKLYA